MGYSQLALINFIENHDMKRCEVADKIGIDNPTLSNHLNGKRHLPFEVSLFIQKILFNDSSDEYIRRVITEYEKMEHIRPGIEFLSLNFYLEEMRLILDKIREFHGKDFNELYTVYNFIYDYQIKAKSYEVLLSELKDIYKSVKSDDLICLLLTIEANIYGYLREYKSLFRLAQECELSINALSKDLMQKSLKVRVYETLARAYLFNKNDGDKSRHYSNLIFSLKICAKSEAYATYIIGTSYMFHNYAESAYHLTKSADMYNKIGLSGHGEIIKRQNLHLLETLWNKNLEYITEDMDDSEKAFRLAKLGESKSALELLDGLEDSAFRKYYRALATKDDSIHFEALGMFMKEGDYFYAQLPIIELEKKIQYKGIIKNLI